MSLPPYVRLWVFGAEGGYSDDPADHGGETKFGISKKSYPELDIANLTREDAEAIYDRDFWSRVHGDDLPPALGLATFDAAVHHGPTKAVMFLQHALQKRGHGDVHSDGMPGPITTRAAKVEAAAHLHALLAEALSFRALFMVDIITADATQRKWIRGWLARLFRLEARCLWLGPF